MREIKFRAWEKETKKMIDLKEITPLALDSSLQCDGLFLPFIENIVLMQFTGLKDKNGKEIYEGDILGRYEDEHWNIFGAVAYDTVPECWTAGSYFLADKEGNISEWGFEEEGKPDNWMHLEIAGNIYENPELLK